jgi:hypothetical protein
MEQHYYNARNTGLLGLGLRPRMLDEELIDTMLIRIKDHDFRIDPATLVQNIKWAPERALEASHV